jgi:hypothetical protein
MADTTRRSPPDDLAGSDFLFHLYRGAELLQENQVHEAKSEIENALRMQPREPQGQDLLAQVYFRLGLYPRSIAIYESLASSFPEEVTPRINLALCYLKTGQPERAREQLEQVVSTEPARQRAWGYLGLAFERLGDYDKARAAFDRAGYASMARRMDALLEHRSPQDPPAIEIEPGPDLAELRSVAEAAFHELDVTDDAFSLALPSIERSPSQSGSWFAVELGHADIKAANLPRVRSQSQGVPDTPSHHTTHASSIPDVASPPRGSSVPAAKPVHAFARDSTLVFPRDMRAAKHERGTLLLSVSGNFVTRVDLVQAFASSSSTQLIASSTVPRHPDGDASVPLGGSTRPLTTVEGARRLVLRARTSFDLFGIELTQESVYVREDCLAGFDGDLRYDHGRMASGHGDTIDLIHVHGDGLVVLELPKDFVAFEIEGTEGCVLRCVSLLGWVGRVVGRSLPGVDSPGGIRGWAAFSGEGVVLFDPTRETEF